jgi:hypothetical protein
MHTSGYVYKEWVLVLHTKQRNQLCKKFGIVGEKKAMLVHNARRFKHNGSQKLYARRIAQLQKESKVTAI